MTEGHLGRHLGTLLDAASEYLGGRVEVCRIEAGLQTPAWLTADRAADIMRLAAARNVEIASTDTRWRGRSPRQGLLLGFAAVDSREIRRGVTELAGAFDRLR